MNLLISFGPLKAYIDDVRCITNNSSGIMGYSLAREALRRKYNVKAVAGPTNLQPLKGLKDWLGVESYSDLKKAMEREFQWADIIIMGTAVCDFVPLRKKSGKIKRSNAGLNLQLKSTSSIIGSLSKKRGRKRKLLVGFSLESEHFIARAIDKRSRDDLDMTLAFYLNKDSMPYGDNHCEPALVARDFIIKMPVLSKAVLAGYVLDVLDKLSMKK
ncbi:MAG: phosphopantothenoylcysteine decarboxylase [Candidatus Kaelpia imicola]|nr:phosphopantothenoylcysteine decarboxylase [Candidatus Kaelpia imicola]